MISSYLAKHNTSVSDMMIMVLCFILLVILSPILLLLYIIYRYSKRVPKFKCRECHKKLNTVGNEEYICRKCDIHYTKEGFML